MSTARVPSRNYESSKWFKDYSRIRSKLCDYYEKMERKTSYSPTQKELEKLAQSMIDFLGNYHSEIGKQEGYFKKGIIDLTNIPEMHPTMQRIATNTALKMTIEYLDQFLANYS